MLVAGVGVVVDALWGPWDQGWSFLSPFLGELPWESCCAVLVLQIESSGSMPDRNTCFFLVSMPELNMPQLSLPGGDKKFWRPPSVQRMAKRLGFSAAKFLIYKFLIDVTECLV